MWVCPVLVHVYVCRWRNSDGCLRDKLQGGVQLTSLLSVIFRSQTLSHRRNTHTPAHARSQVSRLTLRPIFLHLRNISDAIFTCIRLFGETIEHFLCRKTCFNSTSSGRWKLPKPRCEETTNLISAKTLWRWAVSRRKTRESLAMWSKKTQKMRKF